MILVDGALDMKSKEGAVVKSPFQTAEIADGAKRII
jgi:hypothetical protein